MLLAHIKYQITHMLCPTLYAAITKDLIFCDFIHVAIMLKGSLHQEIYEYPITTIHTLSPLSIFTNLTAIGHVVHLIPLIIVK